MSQKLQYVLGAALLVASSMVRVMSYPVVTTDYTYFLAKWFSALAGQPGLSAFRVPFADYAPLYLYVLKLLTFIPVSSLYSIKTLSLLFDIVLAVLAVMIYKLNSPQASGGTLFFIFALLMSVPTFVLNDSLWGQSDIIYAAGVVASLYFILTDRPFLSTLCFALAVSVKVQAVFFLPVLLGYLIVKRAWWQLLWIPAVYAATILPAWFAGGSLSYWFFIYLHQAGEYSGLSISSQSIFSFVTNWPLTALQTDILFYSGIAVVLVCAAALTVAVARTPRTLYARLVLVSFLCAAALPYFLPRMHERYFFLADVFSVLYALLVPRQWYLPVIVVFASVLSYMPFLSSQVAWFSALRVDLRVPSVLMVIALVISTVTLRLHIRAEKTGTYT